jgi:branched-chain amino acid transport system ATP-binding protein
VLHSGVLERPRRLLQHFAAKVADRAYIIETGAMRFEGTMKALMADEAVRQAYLTV